MQSSELLIAFVVSSIVHIAVFTGFSVYSSPEIALLDGDVTLNIRITPSESFKASPKSDFISEAISSAHLPKKAAPSSALIKNKAPSRKSEVVLNRVEKKSDKGSRQNHSGIDKPATVLGLTKPEYPEYCRRHGQEGKVIYEVQVSSKGIPLDIKLVQSSGYKKLDSSALKALKEASFLPAQISGLPIAASKKIAFSFSLEDTK